VPAGGAPAGAIPGSSPPHHPAGSPGALLDGLGCGVLKLPFRAVGAPRPVPPGASHRVGLQSLVSSRQPLVISHAVASSPHTSTPTTWSKRSGMSPRAACSGVWNHSSATSDIGTPQTAGVWSRDPAGGRTIADPVSISAWTRAPPVSGPKDRDTLALDPEIPARGAAVDWAPELERWEMRVPAGHHFREGDGRVVRAGQTMEVGLLVAGSCSKVATSPVRIRRIGFGHESGQGWRSSAPVVRSRTDAFPGGGPGTHPE
jgi:hypothetical protein